MKILLVLVACTLTGCASHQLQPKDNNTITDASIFYKIVTEKVIDFSVENADLRTCIQKLKQETGFNFDINSGCDENKLVSIALENVTLDTIIKIISLYYHVDYTIEQQGWIVIHPLDKSQCDKRVATSYYVPRSHIINLQDFNVYDAEAKCIRYRHGPINGHGMFYRENTESLFIFTCVPQMKVLVPWLRATVPDFDKLQEMHNQRMELTR